MNTLHFKITLIAAFCLQLFVPSSASAQPRDEKPPEILLARVDPNPPKLGFSVEVIAIIKDDRQVQSTRIFYRAGGSTVFDSTFMSLEDPVIDLYLGIIPGQAVTSRGLEGYIYASDGTNITTFPPDNPQDNPIAVPVEADVLFKPTLQPGGRYRMFSVPLLLLGNAAEFSTYFSDDKTKERLFVWSKGRYIEFGTTGFPRLILPGYAVFLIYRDLV